MSNMYYAENKKYEHLGEYFRDKRKLRGVTQQELAAALGISRRQIQRFEDGTPMNSTYLLKIMFILRITSIYSIFGQVKEFKELNQLLGENPSPEQLKVIDKTYNGRK